MDNANTPEYLEKIKQQVIENLKRTTFAPSVQMTDVPRDPEGMNDEADAELDDADEDENPDSRYTKRSWDKFIEKDGELSDSEDEEENEANGVRRQPNAPKRRRNIMDYQNPLAAPDDNLASGVASARSGLSANGLGSHTATDNEREGSPLSEESDRGRLNGAREDSLSSGNPEDDDEMDMAEDTGVPAASSLANDGPQEATPPDSPPTVAGNPTAPSHVVEETGNAVVDEDDTPGEADFAKEEGQNEREKEDITGEESTEVVERSER